MSGIYVHIPFCKQACSYCDFHFSTGLKQKRKMVDALIQEIHLRQSEMESPVETIYFGGGTPSILSNAEMEDLFASIFNTFAIHKSAEITLETNPDDFSDDKLDFWKSLGVNRLSIGIQSLDTDVLAWMNRAHNPEQAINAMSMAQKSGIDNITLDLIYGIPGYDPVIWQDQIKKSLELNPTHISAYCLTVEEKTRLQHQVDTGETVMPNEEQTAAQFILLRDTLAEAGFFQYEVSNFAKDGYESKHNSAYWKGAEYIGIGPSAHSLKGHTRRWNISNNPLYIKKVNEGSSFWETEVLSEIDRYNEYLMTRLRTSWGVHVSDLESIKSGFAQKFLNGIKTYERYFIDQKGAFTLNPEGLLIADRIVSDLFIVD